MKEHYRLGIDLGSTSLGWCMLRLDDSKEPVGIINMGVRIFPDGREMKSHEPLSVKRRGFRGQRRNLDRYLERIKALIRYLMENGFLPEDEHKRRDVFKINPYFLRAKALDEELNPAEFARALIHLAKRRGFKSNRKVLSDTEGKSYSKAIENLSNQLKEHKARTLGEYLWRLYQSFPKGKEHQRATIKFRYADANNPIFPTRSMVQAEFAEIWKTQARFTPRYSEEHRQSIFDIIFNQRPLKPTQKGKCELEPGEERAPKAHPLFQECRILQNLNNIKVVDESTAKTFKLNEGQRSAILSLLNEKKELEFGKIRKVLWGKQADDYRFNLETDKTKKIKGNETNAALSKKEFKDLKPVWDSLMQVQQGEVIDILISDADDDQKVQELVGIGFPAQIAERMLELDLPDKYGNLSLKAIKNILPYLRQGQMYSEACASAGYLHSLEYDGRVFPDGDLPYYGELLQRESIELNRLTGDEEADKHGRINNPTVHVALNQLRKLVNALSLRYGAPAQIVLELGKETRMSAEKRNALIRDMNKNEELNTKIKEFLNEHGQKVTHDNMLRVKLWWELGTNELDRHCVYSGNPISVTDLFSPRIDIDHILPKSRTYDDTTANKLLCTHEANLRKGNLTPYEAFHDSPTGYNWPDILKRAESLRPSQQRRFRDDAMEQFEDENELLARMLNDTRYMSRVAMKYMFYVCGDHNVWSVTGKHTGLLRSKWGLNSVFEDQAREKDRSDHRHHAIDAFVIALTSRSTIKRLADNIRQSRDRFIENLDPPWPGFDREEFCSRIKRIAVSYKPDQISADRLARRKQTGGALVDETAYGYAGTDPDNPKHHLYTVRKEISDLTSKNIKKVVRQDLKTELETLAETRTGKEFTAAVADWASRRNIKKVKLALSMNPESMIPVKDKSGRTFKFLSSGENLFADIYLKNPADPNCKWEIEIVNSYNAHQPGFVPRWKQEYPKAKKIMRVYKNDVIALDTPEGGREFRRVRKMTNGMLFLREINIAKKVKKNDHDTKTEDMGESFVSSSLQRLRARKIGIDIIGRYFDPIVNET